MKGLSRRRICHLSLFLYFGTNFFDFMFEYISINFKSHNVLKNKSFEQIRQESGVKPRDVLQNKTNESKFQ